jgi:hypothetical protein
MALAQGPLSVPKEERSFKFKKREEPLAKKKGDHQVYGLRMLAS